jgi:hypothetical protein
VGAEFDHAAQRKQLIAALGADYEVGDVIGVGGFAVVCAARDVLRRHSRRYFAGA